MPNKGHPTAERATPGQAVRVAEFVQELVPTLLTKECAQTLIERHAALFKGRVRSILGEILYLNSRESWGMPPLGTQFRNLQQALPKIQWALPASHPYRGEDRDDLVLFPTLSSLGWRFRVRNPYSPRGYTRIVLGLLKTLHQRIGLDLELPRKLQIRLKPEVEEVIRRTESKLSGFEARFLVLPVTFSEDYPTAVQQSSGVYPLCTAQLASMILAMPDRFTSARFSKRYGDCYFPLGDVVNDPGGRSYFIDWVHPRWSSHTVFSMRYMHLDFQVCDSGSATNPNYLLVTYPPPTDL